MVAVSSAAPVPPRRRTRLSTRATLGRLLAALAVAVVAVLAGPAVPASAHTVSGAGGQDYVTLLGPLTPAVPGVTVRVVENGSRLALRNTTGQQVVVLGYDAEPYLRVGPDGVFENTLSQATYVNRDRYGGQTGGSVDAATLPPQWRRTGGGPTVYWHDHRAHNMRSDLPPSVRARPGLRQVVQTSDVEIAVGGAVHRAHVELVYLPPPPSWPWWLLGAGLAAGTALLALPRRWPALLALATVGLVSADAVHSVGIGLDKAGTTGERLAAFAAGNAAEGVAWVLGLVGAVLLLRRSLAGPYVAATAAAVVAIVGGYGDVGILSSSTAPFVGPALWARVLTAVSLGVGAGMLGACALTVRRLDREEGRARRDDVVPAA